MVIILIYQQNCGIYQLSSLTVCLHLNSYSKIYFKTIVDSTGPLASCHPYVSPDIYYNNCVFDLCQLLPSASFLCGSVEAYLYECVQVAGENVQVGDWRNSTTQCGKSTDTQKGTCVLNVRIEVQIQSILGNGHAHCEYPDMIQVSPHVSYRNENYPSIGLINRFSFVSMLHIRFVM